ncbi:helix-turn-helix protein [Haloactinospora alba]|uniref:Helix-turn-helix protein n=1 Tax=Haloactinospora alba TaxID=405555 RepID=A0A543N6Q2_9ACTN|nr:helix-turn-helix transcriptional regulator [Haloactinospora alba]TQN27499.1 helix-turn-helix protein [Haloactinospora alba]
MTAPHDALADALDARLDHLGLTLNQLCDRAGIRYETLRAIRKGESRPQRRTVRKLDRALGWDPGQTERILNGSPPPDESPEVRYVDSTEMEILRANLPEERREALLRWRREERSRFLERIELEEQLYQQKKDKEE